MLKIGIQYFAHHKGGGSTKNGRDSEAKRLGVKRADGQYVLAGMLLTLCNMRDEYPDYIEVLEV